MVQPTEDRIRNNVSEPFDLALVGRVLAERNVSSHVIIIGGIFRKNSSKVLGVENDQMIRALAPELTRSNVQHIRSARASGTRWAGPGCPSRRRNRAMRRWRPPQPDLFMTPPPAYDLPPLQRTIVVKLLKVLLAEAR